MLAAVSNTVAAPGVVTAIVRTRVKISATTVAVRVTVIVKLRLKVNGVCTEDSSCRVMAAVLALIVVSAKLRVTMLLTMEAG